MGTLSYPFTLTAGQPENVNQLNSNLSAIQAVLNGNVDSTNLANAAVTLSKLASAVQDLLVPTGTILATALSTVPSSQYLMCDGSAVSRSTYAALFTAISTTYGAGDGSTTFNLPDLRGRVPVGVDGAAGRLASNDALGQSAGEEKHTLTNGEAGQSISGRPNVSTPDISLNTAGFTPHNNMQPYQIVNYMIKT